MQLSDLSSSDEEPADKPWWRRPSRKNNDQMNVVVGELQPLNMRQWPPSRSPPEQSCVENSPDRSSPPLFEVELTASDEDDDASVLELVIPLQSSRYQRLPTSSPKKMRTKTIRLICSFLCCVRK